MSDPLSLLREQFINKKPISHDDAFITIGDLKFPRNTLTAYKQDRGEFVCQLAGAEPFLKHTLSGDADGKAARRASRHNAAQHRRRRALC